MTERSRSERVEERLAERRAVREAEKAEKAAAKAAKPAHDAFIDAIVESTNIPKEYLAVPPDPLPEPPPTRVSVNGQTRLSLGVVRVEDIMGAVLTVISGGNNYNLSVEHIDTRVTDKSAGNSLEVQLTMREVP